MGYFGEAYEISNGSRSFDYVFFGFTILVSPVIAPLYWLGRIGRWVVEHYDTADE